MRRSTTLALAALAFLNACKGNSHKSGSTTLVMASWGGPKTFNPIVENEASSSQFSGMIFSGLTDIDAHTGLPKPALAERWDVDSAGRTYTFHLRDGLKFNDGSPLTAKDVVFTWTKLVFDTAVECATRDILRVDGKLPEVTAPDDRTVVFRLPTVFGPFIAAAGGVPILSEARLKDSTGAKFNTVYGINTEPKDLVGSGPFILARYEGGSRGIFVRNPHYWRKDSTGAQLPRLDTVLISIVQDQKAEFLKFQSGELDVMEVKPLDYPVLKPQEAQGKFTIRKLGPTMNQFFILFNQNMGSDKSGQPYVDPVKLAWFRDVHFRRAVSDAIDRAAIRKIVWNGLGISANGPNSPTTGFWWNSKLPALEKNLDSAQAELAAGGYAKGPDGVLRDKAGHIVKFNLVTNSENAARIDAAGLVRKDLEALGMQVSFTQVEFNALVTRLDNTFDWDCVMLGLGGGGSDPHFGANVWISSGRTHQWYPHQAKPSTDWERELDSLVSAGVKSADPNARKKTYDRLQEVVREQQPLIYLGHPEFLVASRTKWANMDPTPIGGALHNIDELYQKQ